MSFTSLESQLMNTYHWLSLYRLIVDIAVLYDYYSGHIEVPHQWPQYQKEHEKLVRYNIPDLFMLILM